MHVISIQSHKPICMACRSDPSMHDAAAWVWQWLERLTNFKLLLFAYRVSFPAILYLQECDLVSYLNDFEGSTDAILEQNYQCQHSEGYHPLNDNKEWIQQQELSLLPPTLQVFSSTVSPPTSPLPSPPPPTSKHVLHSGRDMQLLRETDAEEESPSSSSTKK